MLNTIINTQNSPSAAPYIGYEAFPGEHTGNFAVTVVNDDAANDGSIEKPHLGGDTLKIRLDYR